MAIRSIILRGFGNGTFNGTIPLVTTRGYSIGAAIVVTEDRRDSWYVIYKAVRILR